MMPDLTPVVGQETTNLLLVVAIGRRFLAMPADRVLRILPAQNQMNLPFLPRHVLGVADIGGKVVPVVDLGGILGIEWNRQEAGELILVACGMHSIAFRVDRALRIVSKVPEADNAWSDSQIERVDLDDCLAKLAPLDFSFLTSGVASVSSSAEDTGASSSNSQAAHDAKILWVEAATERIAIPLDMVVELCESLPRVAIPKPGVIFQGAVIYKETLLPLTALDIVLGSKAEREQTFGSFIIVDIDGRRCALGVKRVVGMGSISNPVDDDIRARLTALLPATSSDVRLIPTAESKAEAAATSYLLGEIAGQACAFELSSVVHIYEGNDTAKAHLKAADLEIGVVGGRVMPVVDLRGLLALQTASRQRTLDHAVSGWNHPDTEKMIDSISLEQALTRKTAHTFSQHALVELYASGLPSFLISVDHVVGIISILDEALIPPPANTLVSAVARRQGQLLWVLDPVRISEAVGRRRDAA